MKDDLVSRNYLLTEYDRQHEGPPGRARKIIEDAPGINVGKWIPCSERMPESDTAVLITFSGRVGNHRHYIHAISIGERFVDDYDDAAWYIDELGYEADIDVLAVEAWMPLPESYKEGEKE